MLLTVKAKDHVAECFVLINVLPNWMASLTIAGFSAAWPIVTFLHHLLKVLQGNSWGQSCMTLWRWSAWSSFCEHQRSPRLGFFHMYSSLELPIKNERSHYKVVPPTSNSDDFVDFKRSNIIRRGTVPSS